MSKKRKSARLPGDPAAGLLVERMIRVDQAGEYGAAGICDVQLAVLNGRPGAKETRRRAAQEKKHLAVFDKLVSERRVRPTALAPVWHVAGFALGAATAMLGERAAMACTVAVEEVIDDHYRRKLDILGEDEPDLAAAIEKFRADEVEHRDTALKHGAEDAPAYPLLSAAIKAGARLASWLSTRI